MRLLRQAVRCALEAQPVHDNQLDFPLRERLIHLLAIGPSSRSIQLAPGLAIGSVKGPARKDNQDRALVAKIVHASRSNCLTVAMVCDGMGGMVDGGRAAAVAASSFIADLAASDGNYLRDRLYQAVWAANAAVHELFHGKGGTTLTAVVFDDVGRGFAAHVGDSRLYRRTRNELTLVTRDDTIQGVVGARSTADRNEDELDNQLIQFVGIGPEIEPHILPLEAAVAGNSSTVAWLITSDGAHGLGKQMLTSVNRNATSVADLMRKLMFVADAAGVNDNATAAVIQPSELEISPAYFGGTTLAIWTPTATLELWVDAPPRLKQGIGPPRHDDEPSRTLSVEPIAKPKRRSSNKKTKAGTNAKPAAMDDPQITDGEDADKRSGPQLNISFGDDD